MPAMTAFTFSGRRMLLCGDLRYRRLGAVLWYCDQSGLWTMQVDADGPGKLGDLGLEPVEMLKAGNAVGVFENNVIEAMEAK